jgi:hypothetical protein
MTIWPVEEKFGAICNIWPSRALEIPERRRGMVKDERAREGEMNQSRGSEQANPSRGGDAKPRARRMREAGPPKT